MADLSMHGGMDNENMDTNKKLYPCDSCDKTYHSKQYLEVHKRTHTGEKPYICDYCGKTFVDKGHHSFHIKHKHTEVNESHPCKLCGKVLKTKSGLMRHIDTHEVQIFGFESKYKKRSKDLYSCPSCDKGFGDKTHLNRHIITHENNGRQNRTNGMKSRYDNAYRKEIADYALKNSREAAMELYNVSDSMVRRCIKLVKESEMCPICGKEFGWQTELVRHMKDVHKDSSLSESSDNLSHHGFISTYANYANYAQNDNMDDDGEDVDPSEDNVPFEKTIKDQGSTDESDDDIKTEKMQDCDEQRTHHSNLDLTEKKKESSRVPFIWSKVCPTVTPNVFDNSGNLAEDNTNSNFTKVSESKDNEESKHLEVQTQLQCAKMNQELSGICVKEEINNESSKDDLEEQFCDEVLDYLDQDMKYEQSSVCSDEDDTVEVEVKEEEEDEKKCVKEEELNSDIDKTLEIKRLMQDIKMSLAGLFECPNCPKTFQHKKNVQKHIRVTHMGIRIECEVCLKSFASKSDLKRHMNTHTMEKSLRCEFCGHYFGHKYTLKKHILSMHSERKLECHLCDKMFPDQTMLQKHIKRHNPTKMFHCDMCNKQFKLKCSLTEHLRSHNEDEQFICEKCPKKYLSARRLKEHDESAHKIDKFAESFTCNSCEKIFYSQRSLRDHAIIHKDVKETMCSICGSTFIGERRLKYHIQNVHSEKSFICDLCPKAFSNIANLIRHKKYHLKQKDFACQSCPKTFYDKRSLDMHLNTVHSENPERYPCKYCLKTYSRRPNIKAHLLVCKKLPSNLNSAEESEDVIF